MLPKSKAFWYLAAVGLRHRYFGRTVKKRHKTRFSSNPASQTGGSGRRHCDRAHRNMLASPAEGLTIMVNNLLNGWVMEDVWLEK